MTKSRFVVTEHKAFRAGLHWDIRFKMPQSKLWASFACRKQPPLEPGKKILAIRTHDHTQKEALFTGTIPRGEYGGGDLSVWDEGSCNIIRFNPGRSMTIEFKGKKLNGIYHFIIAKKYAPKGNVQGQDYYVFKGSIKN